MTNTSIDADILKAQEVQSHAIKEGNKDLLYIALGQERKALRMKASIDSYNRGMRKLSAVK